MGEKNTERGSTDRIDVPFAWKRKSLFRHRRGGDAGWFSSRNASAHQCLNAPRRVTATYGGAFLEAHPRIHAANNTACRLLLRVAFVRLSFSPLSSPHHFCPGAMPPLPYWRLCALPAGLPAWSALPTCESPRCRATAASARGTLGWCGTSRCAY